MTCRPVDDYLALIPWQNADKPNFRAVVASLCQPYVDEACFIAGLPADFDLDTAVGDQLDIIGQWVGPARSLPVPVANLYFSLGVRGAGFGEGYWKGPYDQGVTIQNLDDDTYRRLLRSRILANYGKATPSNAQTILSSFFNVASTVIGGNSNYAIVRNSDISPFGFFYSSNILAIISDSVARTVGTSIIVQDSAVVSTAQPFFSLGDAARGLGSSAIWYRSGLTSATLPEIDMSIIIGIAGATPSILDLEVLVQDLIPVVTAGVRRDIVVSSINGYPLFGLGVENEYVSGLGAGALGISPAAYINAVTGAAA